MGRPKKPVDADHVKRLAAINCSYAEMAAVLGVDESTLTRRFAQVIKEGRALGSSSLKRLMWKSAEAGNITMQIFLGKAICGYSDRGDLPQDPISPTKVVVVWQGHEGATKKPEDYFE